MTKQHEADSKKYTATGAKQPPLVSCVMVTGKDEAHYALAELALDSFLWQTYPNTELIIINDGPKAMDLTNTPAGLQHGNIREVRLPYKANPAERLTLGALRNIGLDESKGEWICQWDDDDYSHPHRISMQMAVRREDCCVLLQHQVRYSAVSNTAYKLECNVGHAGTIIHPKAVVLNNNDKQYPGPALYLRFYHGNNSWDEKHVMREFAGEQHHGRWYLTTDQTHFLASTLKKYGIEVKVGS